MVLAEWVAGCLLVVAHNAVVRMFADRPGHVAVVLVAGRATVARFFNDLHCVNGSTPPSVALLLPPAIPPYVFDSFVYFRILTSANAKTSLVRTSHSAAAESCLRWLPDGGCGRTCNEFHAERS